MSVEPLPTQRTMLQGVAIARWGAWAWLTATTLLQRRELDHPLLAGLLIGLMLVWAAGATWLLRRRPMVLLKPAVAISQLMLSWLLLWLDGVVFTSGHTNGGQNLAGTWPLIATMAASTALGPTLGALGGALTSTGRIAGALANGEHLPTSSRVLSFLASALFYAISGYVWGWITGRLQVVETEVSDARARESVARTLHDGVLQTLALVERRSGASDPVLAAAARASDRDLRAWLYGGQAMERVGLDAQIRRTTDRIAGAFDQQITVNVLLDAEPSQAIADALAGAIGEATMNAAKHASASAITVFVDHDPGSGWFASVRDNGVGFDTNMARRGDRGLVRSIEQRLTEVGGTTQITSTPGVGTEVTLRVPA